MGIAQEVVHAYAYYYIMMETVSKLFNARRGELCNEFKGG